MKDIFITEKIIESNSLRGIGLLLPLFLWAVGIPIIYSGNNRSSATIIQMLAVMQKARKIVNENK